MEVKIWPFFTIRFHRYATRHQVKSKFHETVNRSALRRNKPFKDKHLVYSAMARCDCGAGLAYPVGLPYAKGLGIEFNNWDCADILTGRAIHKEQSGAKVHTGKLPFAFYEIKSEDQPSAYGATTRPKK